MFRKLLIKLTLLNAIIFIFLMGLLGMAIYFYTQKVIYHTENNALREQMEAINDLHGPPVLEPRLRIRREFRPSGVIFWDTDKDILLSNSMLSISETIIKQLYPEHIGEIEEKKVGEVYFRVISKKMITDNQLLTVEYWTIDTQKRLLNTLFLVIVIGWVVGSLLALGAGYFLARRALKPIEAAWDKQQQFVSDASHELRTPLTIIQSRIEMLLKSPRSLIQDKLKDISITLNESRRLSKLVSHLLTLARSDANQIEIEQKPLLLNDLLKHVYEEFEEIVSYQEKTLTLNIGESSIMLMGDHDRLHQLFVIFLDNAMKYTEKKGYITMSATLENHSAVVTIADTGIGISKTDITKIFDRFFQADRTRSRREGSGLGLSIGKWIVEKHGGKINVESELGSGTKFKIIFPKPKKEE